VHPDRRAAPVGQRLCIGEFRAAARWDTYPQLFCPSSSPLLFQGGEKNWEPPRRPKSRWPSSGNGSECRNRPHGAAGTRARGSSHGRRRVGGDGGQTQNPRAVHDSGVLCGCWFSARGLMLRTVSRPNPRCPYQPGAALAPISVNGRKASLQRVSASTVVSRFDPDFLPYGPNAGISGPILGGGHAGPAALQWFWPQRPGRDIPALTFGPQRSVLDIMAVTFWP
jgi:hypothetical protein